MEAYMRLERDFASWLGTDTQNVVCCSSGTAALHLALEVLQLPKESEILIPDYTMIACARAVTLSGHVPVFVDCGNDLLMDTSKIESLITENTQAIMAVHIYGRLCDMEAIYSIARKHSLYVIEDCAECPVPLCLARLSSDALCYSFYKNKIICGEEGGAVVFPRSCTCPLCQDDATTARQLRSLGFTNDHDFWHIPRGHNYRMSNVHAELIVDSLINVDASIATRRAIEKEYDARCPSEYRMPKRAVPWVYDIKIPGLLKQGQTKLVSELYKVGISARYGFVPMSLQKEYAVGYDDEKYSARRRSLAIYQEIIYLPIQPSLFDSQDDIVRMTQLASRAFDVIQSVLG